MPINFQNSYHEVKWDLTSGILNKNVLESHVLGSVDDSSNGFKLQILQNSLIITPTTEEVYYYATKPDHTDIFIKATVSGGYYMVDLTNQVFAVPGFIYSNFQIKSGDKWKTSETFSNKIDSNSINDNLESTDDFIALRDALDSIDDAAIAAVEAVTNANEAVGTANTVIDNITEQSAEIAAAEDIRQQHDSDRPIWHPVTKAEYAALPQSDIDNPLNMYKIIDNDGDDLANELQILIDATNTAKNNAEAVVAEKIGINDNIVSQTEGWSSYKINNKIGDTSLLPNTDLVSSVNEVNKKFLDMVTVNIKDFGAVSDALYFNPANNKYYQNAGFTIPCTDNASVFDDISAFVHGMVSVKVLFPDGFYYSSKQLSLWASYIEIEGINAKLITSCPSAMTTTVNIRTDYCKDFRCHGMIFENIIENKSIVNNVLLETDPEYIDYDFYHIHIKDNVLEYCNIYDNIFIDKVSTPNALVKPYNGSIYTGRGKDVFIHNNKFYNSCGRIIFCTGCDNVNIYDNQLEEVGFLNTEVTNINVGSLVFRILDCKHVHIHDNTVNGTMTYNALSGPVFGVYLGFGDADGESDFNIDIHNNSFMVNESKMDVFRLSSVINASIKHNNVFLNDTNLALPNAFLALDNMADYVYYQILDVVLADNRIYNAHEKMVNTVSQNSSTKIRVILQNNMFYSKVSLTKITETYTSNLWVTNGVIRFISNKMFVNGVYDKDLTGMATFDYNVNMNPYPLILTSSNYMTYLTTGVLNIPKIYNKVIIYTSGITLDNITDIKFDGVYVPNKELDITYITASVAPVIKYNNALIRLPNQVDITMVKNETVKLKYIVESLISIAHWFKIN